MTAIKEVVNRFGKKEALLLQVILAVQDADPQNHLSEEAVNEISREMNISRSRVYSTASFYSEISLKPRGIHIIRICTNAPCENANKASILAAIKQELGIKIGQTTADGLFSLESVNCLGACYMSPAIKIDDAVYGDLTPEAAVTIIHNLRKEYQDEQNA
ncbi:MAG: NAD(P)H-dependent oxidoreductase subunit E [Dehalobacter sp. 4CP]|uniref:NADH-quinone oxidoreductase subunit NuoE family protein n=1 Tax=Dehalobacter sp. CP TaxID=2594474 RepID=UPI0013C5E628|nr:NAD(P)H-dependent oxidoreductase subunit E [Dehalobacter sp. 4CP]